MAIKYLKNRFWTQSKTLFGLPVLFYINMNLPDWSLVELRLGDLEPLCGEAFGDSDSMPFSKWDPYITLLVLVRNHLK